VDKDLLVAVGGGLFVVEVEGVEVEGQFGVEGHGGGEGVQVGGAGVGAGVRGG